MAKQSSIIKLEGTIGDISFYKSKDGYLARGKGGVDKSRIQSDPAFQRTRENGSEFGRAGSAGRTLRTAFRPMLLKTSDSRVTSRLTQEMTKVIQADATNGRGERNVLDGELELLTGFEFNSSSGLGSTLYVTYTATLSRETGNALVEIPSFVPQNSVAAPQGATHLKFISAAAEINFENGSFNLETSDSPEIVIGGQTEDAISLTSTLPAASTQPLFLVFGIEFYQEVNGTFYPLKSGSYNALAIVAVDGGGAEPTP
ncbi:MAG TPA: hypothetical protein PKH79_10970 [Prolixibacteraceae bacterium]|nr:hypothetical protein [Prolixibacteraceae bacterium]HPS13119.1 hypothetical protein [Prolixibacteraceae bacterium]